MISVICTSCFFFSFLARERRRPKLECNRRKNKEWKTPSPLRLKTEHQLKRRERKNRLQAHTTLSSVFWERTQTLTLNVLSHFHCTIAKAGNWKRKPDKKWMKIKVRMTLFTDGAEFEMNGSLRMNYCWACIYLDVRESFLYVWVCVNGWWWLIMNVCLCVFALRYMHYIFQDRRLLFSISRINVMLTSVFPKMRQNLICGLCHIQ